MAELKEKVIANEDPKTSETKEAKMARIEKNLLLSLSTAEVAKVTKSRRLFQQYQDARRRYDWEWLSRDLFRRGYQFTKYNNKTNTVTMGMQAQSRIPVNITQAALRSIRNQVTAFRPKWEVLPNRLDTEAKMNATYSGKLLDHVYRRMRLKKTIKETVTQGLLFSVGGPWEIGWDSEIVNEDGSKGFIYIWETDPFDFYVDPNCTDGLAFSDAEGLIKTVRKNVWEVRSNPHYEVSARMKVMPDNRQASSTYKQFLLQAIKYQGQYSTPDNETCIVYQGKFKKRAEDGTVTMEHITWVDSVEVPLEYKEVKSADYPYRMYQADLNPLEVYGEGWARHVIPINKVINVLESSQFDYNFKYNKGRILMDKNSGIRMIDDQHATIIEKNRGADVRPFPLQPLVPSTETQIQRMRLYFEDISGAHDVSLGRIPVGVHSGIGIAELKQADATNQDDLVDNLEDFLVEVAKKVLKTVSENLTFPQLIKATNIAGDADYFAIIGEKAGGKRSKNEVKIGKKSYPLAVISDDNSIDVQIGSWLAYSKQQRQQELKNLYSTGVIDQRTLLEHLEFGDIEQIISRTKKEAIIKKRRDLQQIGKATDVTEEELAMSENQMLIEGNTDIMAMPTDDHDLHIAVHDQYRTYDLVNLHIEEHEAMLREERAVSKTAPAGAGGEIPEGMVNPVPEAGAQPTQEELMQALQQAGGGQPLPAENAGIEGAIAPAVAEVPTA